MTQIQHASGEKRDKQVWVSISVSVSVSAGTEVDSRSEKPNTATETGQERELLVLDAHPNAAAGRGTETMSRIPKVPGSVPGDPLVPAGGTESLETTWVIAAAPSPSHQSR